MIKINLNDLNLTIFSVPRDQCREFGNIVVNFFKIVLLLLISFLFSVWTTKVVLISVYEKTSRFLKKRECDEETVKIPTQSLIF